MNAGQEAHAVLTESRVRRDLSQVKAQVMCAGEGLNILHAYSWRIPLFLLPRWLLYRAGIEDIGAPHPGETPATGASVLWGGRRYLKSTKPHQKAEQFCCFSLVDAKIAVSRLLSLQI